MLWNYFDQGRGCLSFEIAFRIYPEFRYRSAGTSAGTRTLGIAKVI